MILRLVIGIIVVYLLYKLVRTAFPKVDGKRAPANLKASTAGEELVEDPECHTYVPISQAFPAVIDGKKLHFCSQKCLKQYRER